MAEAETVMTFADRTDYLGPMIDRGAALLYRWIRLRANQEVPEQIRCFNTSRALIGLDTNLPVPNRMLIPESFIIRSIHSYWDHGWNQEDRASLCRYEMDLQIAQRSFFRSPLLVLTDLGTVMPELGDGPLPDGPVPLNQDAEVDLEKEQRRIIPGAFGEYPRIIPPQCFFDVILTGKPFVPKSDLGYCLVLNGWWDRGIA